MSVSYFERPVLDSFQFIAGSKPFLVLPEAFLPGNCRARKGQVSHFERPPIVNNILMWTFVKGREENLLTAGNCQARKVSHFKGRLL